MSKAEDLAIELFPLLETDKIGNNPYISYNTEQLAKREGFINGYHQAKKDLELTWKDIREIIDISFEEATGLQRKPNIYKEQYYQEVLKRFNERKHVE